MLSDALPSQLRQRLDSRNGKAPAAALAERERPEVGKENAARTAPAARPAPSPSPSQCVREVERMRMRRAAMREAVEEQRRIRGSDDGTAEFQQMITDFRRNLVLNPALAGRATAEPAAGAPARRIRVAVRKRPLLPHELESAAYDTVTCAPDGKRIVVHEPKTRVDLQKCMESHAFEVDDVFSDAASTSDVYDQTVGELVAAMFDGCSSTCFTYGQTGSGKTYTMLGKGAAEADVDALACACADDLGLYHLAARDCFEQLEVLRREGVALYLGVSFFEVYCGGVHDLLNGRRPCRVLEDAQGEVVVRDLEELVPDSLQHMLQITSAANSIRCVGTTSANEHSSRSHAVLQLTLRLAESGDAYGRFSLVDLAGSERAADSADATRTTRNEGAEINKSLLVLKECIRALGAGQAHTPFRGSKLTQVLRDAFTGEAARSVMIANISPGSHSVEHTLNTLRYAVRLSNCCTAHGPSATTAPTLARAAAALPSPRAAAAALPSPHGASAPSPRGVAAPLPRAAPAASAFGGRATRARKDGRPATADPALGASVGRMRRPPLASADASGTPPSALPVLRRSPPLPAAAARPAAAPPLLAPPPVSGPEDDSDCDLLFSPAATELTRDEMLLPSGHQPSLRADDATYKARLERAVGVLTDVLHCAYEPETWKEEMALLGAESDSVENVRAYAEHLDEVLAERLALFDELRKQLRMFTRTLT